MVYTCPMHPDVKQDNPGICPNCGMNLILEKSKNQEHYNKHEGHKTETFAKKFWISFFLTIPILLYSELPKILTGWELPQFQGSQYIQLIFSSVLFFYCGWVFIIGAYREIRAKLPGMMTLIGFAISTAYIYSIFAIFVLNKPNLFWELATLITVMLLGHWLEMKAIQGAQSALNELAKLLPDKAELIIGNKTKIIQLNELKINDVVLVRPGAKIPADGIVIKGNSDVNESIITGESTPVSKNIGSEVIAGTINGDGILNVEITKIGEKTFLAGVMKLVAEAQTSKSRIQNLSDKAAFYLTIIAVIAGGLTFFIWISSKEGVTFALERLVAVLVVACPHALGLAIPLVASISTTMAARGGLLIKQRLALESARKIDIILFDKTGTLTKGEYGVDKIIKNSKTKYSEDIIIQFAASADKPSEHFVAKAIVNEAEKRKLKLLEVKKFNRIPGKGVKGIIKNNEVYIGGESILSEKKIKIPIDLMYDIKSLSSQGKTIIFVVIKNELSGIIALSDIIRKESVEAINNLKDMNVKVAMITGDSEDVAKWVSYELKIDEYFAKVLPGEKADKVKLLQSRGLKVAMVGDGVNDAPALTQADVGIAIGAGTNIAIESAGIILVKNDPRDIVKIIKLSKKTYNKMIQNLFWASGYNIIAIPLAGGVLFFKGILLQPALAALFMSLSTVIVAINAILLRKFKI
ncbi:heavy metal translocating P-type ATPase [Candidatus Woesearchaeota archaeon]|nr:heavy metal translocating P-type ATPase [Candidatus Woesearchaeota archaeon]